MTKQMTSRERVATALNHQEPDRVPLDIGAGQSTGLVVEAYENLQAYTGITGVSDWLSKTFRVARLDDAQKKAVRERAAAIRRGEVGPAHEA